MHSACLQRLHRIYMTPRYFPVGIFKYECYDAIRGCFFGGSERANALRSVPERRARAAAMAPAAPAPARAETLVFVVASGLGGAELAAVIEELKNSSKGIG